MLRPHDAENAQLGQVRLAAKNALYSFKFFGCDVMLFEDLRRDLCFGHLMSVSRQETETEILSFLEREVDCISIERMSGKKLVLSTVPCPRKFRQFLK